MIKLYDVVRIKDSGITGIVTNINSAKGRTFYTVENNKRGKTGIPGARNDDSDSFAVFDCMKGELEKVAGGGEGDDPKGGYKYICTTCGGKFCFEFMVVNCPSCGNSTLQEVDQEKKLEPWRPVCL